MRLTVRWVTISALLTALAPPCFGADDQPTWLIVEEPVPTTQRLDQIEAELAALGLRLDGIPQQCCNTPCAGCDCCPPCGAYAGFAFVFARPHFSENLSYRILEGTQYDLARTLVSFPTGHEITPRIWVGYLGTSGFGLRYRYWQFDHGGAQVSPEDPGANWAAYFDVKVNDYRLGPSTDQLTAQGDRLAISYGLQVYASDLELTQRVVFCDIAINFSGGLRFGRIDQDCRASDTVDEVVVAHRNFRGLGPIVGLDWRRPVRSWGFFGGVRGSVLFGETDFHVDAIDFSPADWRYREYNWNDSATIIGVAEAEIGVEWTRTLASGALLFVRVGYEGQLWLDAGSPNSPNGDLGFEGFSLAFGFDR